MKSRDYPQLSLKDNRVRRATGMRKLQWTCRSIHTMLLERALRSVIRVCAIMSDASVRPAGTRPQKEVYVRREHDPGQECEFDWGDPLVIGGRRQMVQMAVFTAAFQPAAHGCSVVRTRCRRWRPTVISLKRYREFPDHGVRQIRRLPSLSAPVVRRPAVKYPTKAMQRSFLCIIN